MSVLVPFPALRPETLRSVVVVSDDGEVAVVVRDALPRAMVLVLDSRPDEAAAAIAVCRPYPWVLVQGGRTPPPHALLSRRHQTLVLAGPTADAAPPNALRWFTVGELVDRLQHMLTAEVGGMRLAPGIGVELPGGVVVRSASLQALVSVHPAGVHASAAALRALTSLLGRRNASWTATRDATGLMSLVAVRAST